MPPPLIKGITTLGRLLKGAQSKWALGGDAGEFLLGVAVKTDHLEILTNRAWARKSSPSSC